MQPPLFRQLSADGAFGVIGGVDVDVEIAGVGNKLCSNVFVDWYACFGGRIGGERYYGWSSDADSAGVDVGHGQSIKFRAGERVAELARSQIDTALKLAGSLYSGGGRLSSASEFGRKHGFAGCSGG